MRLPRLAAFLALGVLVSSCAAGREAETVAPLPETTPAAVAAMLDGSERPIVLNVWASWCGPCRSEAPLLRTAHDVHGDRVAFIGVAVRDSQAGARAFLAEFDLDRFDHFFDRTGAVPAALGGRGVPITFFFRPGGELLHLHGGVIDERTLALLIDELLG